MDHKKLYSIADTARLLKVPEHRIRYLHRANKVPPPGLVAGRRLYRWGDIKRLARCLGVDLDSGEEGPCS